MALGQKRRPFVDCGAPLHQDSLEPSIRPVSPDSDSYDSDSTVAYTTQQGSFMEQEQGLDQEEQVFMHLGLMGKRHLGKFTGVDQLWQEVAKVQQKARGEGAWAVVETCQDLLSLLARNPSEQDVNNLNAIINARLGHNDNPSPEEVALENYAQALATRIKEVYTNQGKIPEDRPDH